MEQFCCLQIVYRKFKSKALLPVGNKFQQDIPICILHILGCHSSNDGEKTTSAKTMKRKKSSPDEGWEALIKACKTVEETPQERPDVPSAFGTFVEVKLRSMPEARQNSCISQMMQIMMSEAESSSHSASTISTPQHQVLGPYLQIGGVAGAQSKAILIPAGNKPKMLQPYTTVRGINLSPVS